MDENEVMDSTIDSIWKIYNDIKAVGTALGLEKDELQTITDDTLKKRERQNQKELLTINTYLSKLSELIKEYECSISADERMEIYIDAEKVYEDFKEKWKTFISPETEGSISTSYASEAYAGNPVAGAVYLAGTLIGIGLALRPMRDIYDKAYAKQNPSLLSTRAISKMNTRDKIPAMVTSIYFVKMNNQILKILSKYDSFTVNKEVYNIIVDFKNKYYNTIAQNTNEMIDLMENDEIIKNKKSYMFKEPIAARDEAILASLVTALKQLNTTKTLLDTIAGFDAKAVKALETAESPDETIVSADAIRDLLFSDKEVQISQKLGGYIGILASPDNPTVFEHYRKAIEVYQPISSVRPDNVKAPIVAYLYYEMKLNSLLKAATQAMLQYQMVVYEILRFIRPVGKDDTVVIDMVK